HSSPTRRSSDLVGGHHLLLNIAAVCSLEDGLSRLSIDCSYCHGLVVSVEVERFERRLSALANLSLARLSGHYSSLRTSRMVPETLKSSQIDFSSPFTNMRFSCESAS